LRSTGKERERAVTIFGRVVSDRKRTNIKVAVIAAVCLVAFLTLEIVAPALLNVTLDFDGSAFTLS
jgi:hypothetical protein